MDKPKKIQYLEKILRWMCFIVLKKYKPQVIGITGSVGKTSTKEAVFSVLSKKYKVRKNEKNYNNEIGIPLTIIGAESGKRSIVKWLMVFLKWLGVVIFPVRYPEILVIEMGVDRPGDMKYLTSFVKPNVGIMTSVSSSHLEFFRNVDHIAKEKGRLIKSLPEDGMAILNNDDRRVSAMNKDTEAKVLTFGVENESNLRADNMDFNYENGKPYGISFKLLNNGSVVPVRMPHVFAFHLVYAALAAAAAGIFFKVNLSDIAEALKDYHPPEGRMNLIPGIKNAYIIDDTYNASPSSTILALDVLDKIKGERKIAVLGDMLELGSDSESGHERVGEKVYEIGSDKFIAVGERMEAAVNKAKSLGYSSHNIYYFENPVLAGKQLQEIMREGDLILVKGSQGMRMEKIVEEVMRDPLESEKLLCRQTKDWRKKPFIRP